MLLYTRTMLEGLPFGNTCVIVIYMNMYMFCLHEKFNEMSVRIVSVV